MLDEGFGGIARPQKKCCPSVGQCFREARSTYIDPRNAGRDYVD